MYVCTYEGYQLISLKYPEFSPLKDKENCIKIIIIAFTHT